MTYTEGQVFLSLTYLRTVSLRKVKSLAFFQEKPVLEASSTTTAQPPAETEQPADLLKDVDGTDFVLAPPAAAIPDPPAAAVVTTEPPTTTTSTTAVPPTTTTTAAVTTTPAEAAAEVSAALGASSVPPHKKQDDRHRGRERACGNPLEEVFKRPAGARKEHGEAAGRGHARSF